MLKILKRNLYIITIIVIFIIVIVVLLRKQFLNNVSIFEDNLALDSSLEEEKNDEEIDIITKIKVDIKGEVINPGVYEVDSNARTIDLINLAGGLTENANTSLINLSKILKDQDIIIIYSNYEVANSNVKEVETVFKVIEKECNCPNIKNDGCVNTELPDKSLININTASLEELMTLSGIGESKAKAIIEYREKNAFTSIEDVMNVSGISETIFNKIKEYIKV